MCAISVGTHQDNCRIINFSPICIWLTKWTGSAHTKVPLIVFLPAECGYHIIDSRFSISRPFLSLATICLATTISFHKRQQISGSCLKEMCRGCCIFLDCHEPSLQKPFRLAILRSNLNFFTVIFVYSWRVVTFILEMSEKLSI